MVIAFLLFELLLTLSVHLCSSNWHSQDFLLPSQIPSAAAVLAPFGILIINLVSRSILFMQTASLLSQSHLFKGQACYL